jgi:TonB family protein
VWFEEKDGKPVVFVSVPAQLKEPVADKAKAGDPRVTLKVRPKIEYPIDAARAKMEGSAELLFQLNGQGEVIHTKLLSSVPNPVFGDEALRGARRAQFSLETVSNTPEKNWCVTLSILFCLQTPARFPSQSCLTK